MKLEQVSYELQSPYYSETRDGYILSIYNHFGQRKDFYWYTIHKKIPQYFFWFLLIGHKYKRLIGPIFPEENFEKTREIGKEHLKSVIVNL